MKRLRQSVDSVGHEEFAEFVKRNIPGRNPPAEGMA
jgi:hypothetical protein